MSEKKKWSDFTNKELIEIYSNPNLVAGLKYKVWRVIEEQRGISLSDLYYGRFDPDAKGLPCSQDNNEDQPKED